jgi:type IV pilus assembly protein PilW
MIKNPDNLRIKAQTGFSLVDVMVGMVIALLGVIIMFQVFSVSEGVKRTTTSGGDALQNSASALFTLERSLKQAGYGIFGNANQLPAPSDPAGTAPVLITPGAANTSDTIFMTYRQNWDFGSFPPDPTNFPLTLPPALTIETVSVNGQAQLVSSTAPDPAPLYATALPAAVATPAVVISEGIVLLKAEYGTDVTGTGTPLTWSQGVPVNVRSVKAVRLAVVARSVQPEKPSVAGGACDTTIAYPIWSGSNITATNSTAVPLDLSANLNLATGGTDDWKCYRYKTFENTVPLRND